MLTQEELRTATRLCNMFAARYLRHCPIMSKCELVQETMLHILESYKNFDPFLGEWANFCWQICVRKMPEILLAWSSPVTGKTKRNLRYLFRADITNPHVRAQLPTQTLHDDLFPAELRAHFERKIGQQNTKFLCSLVAGTKISDIAQYHCVSEKLLRKRYTALIERLRNDPAIKRIYADACK